MLPSPRAVLRSVTSGLGRGVTRPSPQNRPGWISMAPQVAGLIRREGRTGSAKTAGRGPAQEVWEAASSSFQAQRHVPWMPGCPHNVGPCKLCASLGTVLSNGTLRQPRSSQTFLAGRERTLVTLCPAPPPPATPLFSLKNLRPGEAGTYGKVRWGSFSEAEQWH